MFGLERFRDKTVLQWVFGGLGSFLLLCFIGWMGFKFFYPDFRFIPPGPSDKVFKLGLANIEIKDSSGTSLGTGLARLTFRKPQDKQCGLEELKLIPAEVSPNSAVPRALGNPTIRTQVWALNGGLVVENECRGEEPSPQVLVVTTHLEGWSELLPKGTQFTVQFKYNVKTESPTAKKVVIISKL